MVRGGSIEASHHQHCRRTLTCCTVGCREALCFKKSGKKCNFVTMLQSKVFFHTSYDTRYFFHYSSMCEGSLHPQGVYLVSPYSIYVPTTYTSLLRMTRDFIRAGKWQIHSYIQSSHLLFGMSLEVLLRGNKNTST